MLTCKDLPSPLDRKDYSQVRFWTAKSFEAYCDNNTGDTDGLATQHKKRGRLPKSETTGNRYLYLENTDGSIIPRDVFVKMGQKARRLWQAMYSVGLAPSSWGKASEIAYNYFNGEMLNDPEFKFFRYCEGNWKLMRWATKSYPSWAHNHLKSSDASETKTSPIHMKKRRHEVLDNPSLLEIDDDQNEDIVALASPMPSASGSIPVQVSLYRL